MPTVTVCRGETVCEQRINSRSWYVTDSGILVASTDLTQVGTPTQISITTQPSSTATSGGAFAQQPVIQLRDAVGDPVSLADVTITASIASDPGGSPTLSNETAVTNGSGTATYSGLTITGTSGAYTLDFDAAGLTGVTSNTITLSAAPSGVVFHSDWSYGVGDSHDADYVNIMTDGGTFTQYAESMRIADGPQTTIMSASGIFTAGFTNCMRTELDGTNANVQMHGEWPIPGVGEDLYYRVYVYYDIPNSEPTNSYAGNHGIEVPSSGNNNWSWKFGHTNGSANFTIYLSTPGQMPFDFIGPTLTFRTEYRFETRIHKVSSTTFWPSVRIYSAGGTLIHDETDFGGNWDMANHNPIACENAAWDDWIIGTNGPGWSFGAGTCYYYYGGVCVSDDDWCGVYTGGI